MAADPPMERINQTQFDEAIRKHRYFSIGKQGGARAVFKFKDMSGLDFRGADFSGADFTGSNLSNANMKRCTFVGAALYGCNLDGANIEWTNFSRADMRGTSMVETKTEGADLSTADLRDGKIFASKKDQVRSQTQKTLDYSEKNEQRGAYADLSSKKETARSSDLDLSNTDEELVRKADIDLSETASDDQRLSNLDLSETPEDARVSDFVLAGDPELLRTAEISLEQTENPMLARLTSHAQWIASKGARGEQLDISGLDMRDIRDLVRFPLIAIKARGANFSGMHLAGVHMQSAQLEECDFSNANLSQADLRGSSLRRANLRNANLKDANLGPLIFGDRHQAVDLTGADLSGTILEQPD